MIRSPGCCNGWSPIPMPSGLRPSPPSIGPPGALIRRFDTRQALRQAIDLVGHTGRASVHAVRAINCVRLLWTDGDHKSPATTGSTQAQRRDQERPFLGDDADGSRPWFLPEVRAFRRLVHQPESSGDSRPNFSLALARDRSAQVLSVHDRSEPPSGPILGEPAQTNSPRPRSLPKLAHHRRAPTMF